MENRLNRLATKTAISYVHDGYRLYDYRIEESPPQYIYRLRHANENEIKVVADVIDKAIYIFLNGRLNKTINDI